MLEAWCPHWQYWKVAVLFCYYDKVPEESNFSRHLLWLMYNPPFRRKNDGKNGSSCGSRNVKQLVTLSPQSGMNAGTQLTFSFFSFYSICPPHPHPTTPRDDAIHIQSDLLSSAQFLWKHPYKYIQRYGSWVILNPIKLTTNLTQHLRSNPAGL